MFVLVVFAIVVLAVYLQKTAPFFLLSSKLPGPFAFPIIGCAWKFINKNPEEVMEAVAEISSGYPSPLRFWLGPKFLVIIKDPENTRMILTSTRMNTKGDIYRFLGPLLGNGLITGSGVFSRTVLDILYLIRENNRVSMEGTQKNYSTIAEWGPFKSNLGVVSWFFPTILGGIREYGRRTRI